MHSPPEIQGLKIILRPMSLEYVTPRYLGWLSDPTVTRHLSTSNYTIAQLTTYVEERIEQPNICFWAIIERSSGMHIGNVKLEPIVLESSRATFGILIGEKDFWGKGIATEVAVLVADFAFQSLGLSKVDLGVQDANAAAIRAYEKAGFHVEGRLRRHSLVGGCLRDVIYMAKFADGSNATNFHSV